MEHDKNTPEGKPVRLSLATKLKHLLRAESDRHTSIQTSMLAYFKLLGVAGNEWIELQALDPRTPSNLGLRHGTVGAYVQGIREATDRLYEADDPERGIEPVGLYVIPNVIAPGVEARGQRGRWTNIEHGTADKDITARRAFYVDCDPVRPSGVQANVTEMNASVVLFQSVYKRLVELVGEDALGLGFSGSGMQIHVALGDVPNTADVTGLIKAILVALDLTFSTTAAKIDTSVCDSKRLAPAWGTIKRKGATGHTERAWRATAFVCHEEVKRLSLADLCSLLTELRKSVPEDKQGEIEKALGLKSAVAATASSSIPKTREPQRSDALARCNEVSIRDVAGRLGIDLGTPVCPWCGGNTGVDLLDKKGMNILKCLHATCGSKAAGSVMLVAKVAFGHDSLKGNAAAVKDVIGWFTREFGIEDSPRQGGRRHRTERPKPEGSSAVDAVDDGGDDTEVASTDIEIELGVDTHRVVLEAVHALARDPETYARGQHLVSVEVHDGEAHDGLRTPGGLRSTAIPTAVLRTVTLSRCATWLQYVPKDQTWVATRVPSDIATAVSQLGTWPGVRQLIGITETPVMRPDGSILVDPGYDASTGLVYRPSGTPVAIKTEPDRADALFARDELLEVVCDMPLDASARATWLALVLSYFARPMFEGPTPIVIADGNLKGTAKTLCIKAAARLATGRGPASLQYIHGNEEEVEKRITATLMGAYPFVLFDNIENGGYFGNAKIDALATGDWWSGRMLGASTIVDVPNRTIWAASGNNLVVVGDTLRRVIHIRFDTDNERPEDRQDFKHPDLIAWVASERSRLVAAALTVLRAWVIAGRPRRGITMGSFEGWASVVAEAVAWVTDIDVTLTRRALEERDGAGDAADVRPLYEALANVYESQPFEVEALLRDLQREDRRVDRELQRLARDHDDASDPVHALSDLREAVCALTHTKGNALPDKRWLGRALSRLLGRPCGGLRLVRVVSSHSKTSRWKLSPVAGSTGVAGSLRVLPENVEPAHSVREKKGDSRFAGSAGSFSDPGAFRDEEVTKVHEDDLHLHLIAAFGGEAEFEPAEPANDEIRLPASVESAGSSSERRTRKEPAENPQSISDAERLALLDMV